VRLVFDDALWVWARDNIPNCPADPFGASRSIGVHDGREIIAVCVYHNYADTWKRCEISFAAKSPRWATRGVIRALLSVPFEQYRCETVYTFTPKTNTRALRFNEGIGLINPSEVEDYYGPGINAVIRRMKRGEYFDRYGMTRIAA
jgi:RimJ/RimL family protein N-acetyltransferase